MTDERDFGLMFVQDGEEGADGPPLALDTGGVVCDSASNHHGFRDRHLLTNITTVDVPLRSPFT